MRRPEFNSILFSPLMCTNEVKRYSGTRLQEEEPLSQHITDMCMMSYIIAKRLNAYGEELDTGLILEKCLVHDLDELATGDMPRNTKYATPNIKKELDEVAKLAVQRYESLHEGLDGLEDMWEHAKDGKEGFIVKLVDMLCVVRKAVIEIELYGNLSCLKVTKELDAHLSKLGTAIASSTRLTKPESIEFVKELVAQSKDIISDLNARYRYVSETYNVTKNILEE